MIDVKLLISKISGIPSKQLRLKFENKVQMEDSKSISDYKDFLVGIQCLFLSFLDPALSEIFYTRVVPPVPQTPRLLQTGRKSLPTFYARKSLAASESVVVPAKVEPVHPDEPVDLTIDDDVIIMDVTNAHMETSNSLLGTYVSSDAWPKKGTDALPTSNGNIPGATSTETKSLFSAARVQKNNIFNVLTDRNELVDSVFVLDRKGLREDSDSDSVILMDSPRLPITSKPKAQVRPADD